MLDQRKPHRIDTTLTIPAKANRILNIVLIAMILIALRVWHLTVIQYEEKLEESRKPQRRVFLEPAKRGAIVDRFNSPLAVNKLQYNVSIIYSQIKHIPTIVWETNKEGKRVKRFKRKEYIKTLSCLLGNELNLDIEKIEDLIHAKAALYNQIPFVLKEGISEKEYYRLKMLEKDWPGIAMQKVPYRYYPKGKIASHIIGYMGAINQQEYDLIIGEIKALESFIGEVDSGEISPLPEGIETAELAQRRLKDLQALAYLVNDSIGKSGIEGRFDNILKGFRGKKSYYSNAKGNFLKELPGSKEPLSGKRIVLTISSELQEYAEQLLIQNESIRRPTLSRLTEVKRTINADKEPWIKGGAIIAIDPNNGEILAMASHPRFDPNDFILFGKQEELKQKKKNLSKWLEDENYLADIWNMQRPLARERYNKVAGIYNEENFLSWERYLNLVLSNKKGVRNTILKNGTLFDAVYIQKNVDQLLSLTECKDIYQLLHFLYRDENHTPYGKKLALSEIDNIEKKIAKEEQSVKLIKEHLNPYFNSIEHTYDKVLMLDLLRITVDSNRFTDQLLNEVGRQSLSDYKEISAAFFTTKNALKGLIKALFHETEFKEWRKQHEKDYLKQKREEEKKTHRYARPYIDYLDSLENTQFETFWQQFHLQFLLAFLIGKNEISLPEDKSATHLQLYLDYLEEWSKEIAKGAHRQIEWADSYITIKNAIVALPNHLKIDYLNTLRSFQDLTRPLFGKYNHLKNHAKNVLIEKDLAAAFYPKYGYGYGRSQAYRQATTLGSIFKLVTAYEALIQRYKTLKDSIKTFELLNPLIIDDVIIKKGKSIIVGFQTDGTPIPRHYKGGRMPRSLSPKIGKIDILKALERSSNPYFALLAGDFLNSPNDLAEAARQFSYGNATGIDLPGEISGNIPNDLELNRTGLHSFSIGQHTLVVTPLQTSIMLSSLVNGGKIFKPKIIRFLVGKEPKREESLIVSKGSYLYEEVLNHVGIDFPLFIEADPNPQKRIVKHMKPEIKRHIFLPIEIEKILIEGMRVVVERTQAESLPSLIKLYKNAPEAIQDYIQLKAQFIGKTSTAESVENIDLELHEGTNIYTHVWFGGIAYDQNVQKMDPHQFLFRDSVGKPELVVVVYLKYGGYGKESAPVAAQIAKKWKEIKAKIKKEKSMTFKE